MLETPGLLTEDIALKWAAAALSHFPVEKPAVCLIAHSENMTFHVADGAHDREFLLRLHIPAHAYLRGVRQMSLAIQSELHWLDALAADTALPLQQPQRTREGDLLAIVDLSNGQSAPATLLTWLDGAPFQLASAEAAAMVQQLGSLLARLHNHSESWQVPLGFVRPHYETDYLGQIGQGLLEGVYQGVLSEQDYLVCERSLGTLNGALIGLKKDAATWGLIHNDLHTGNCLVVDHQVLPIDFSLSGFGYYLFDIGVTLGSLPAHFRKDMLSGYRNLRALPDESLNLIEGSLIASRLSYYSFILQDPTQHGWLRSRMAKTVEDLCRPFLAGEHFLMKVR
jgi:Ser/Thr protein kinase RdoA (MazF antagonist)